MEAANHFLQTFIKLYNQRFAVSPENSESAYRELPDSINLDHILCVKESRTVLNGSVFSLDQECYQIVKKGKIMPVIPKAKITILTGSKIGVMAEYSGSVYETIKLPERPKKTAIVKTATKPKSKAHKPSPDHYWKNCSLKTSKPFVEESDREIIEALYSSRLAWR
jgi:hypothetical protein